MNNNNNKQLDNNIAFNVLIALLLIFSVQDNLSAQFYNGHKLHFGKNRVQYNKFYWEYYRFPKFDTYFYLDGLKLARYTSRVIEKELNDLESFFNHSLKKRIIFIIYNKQSEFKQSNIGLVSGNDETNIGGSAKIVNNKVFIYYEGDHRKFVKQIRAAIAEVLFHEVMYGGTLRQRLSSSAFLNIPTWYHDGLIAYLTENWNFEVENRIKDALENGKLNKFNHLQDEEAKDAGHAIWYFLEQNYGKSIIPNILYLAKVNRNIENGFLYVLGFGLNSLTPMWLDFYKERFEKDNKTTNFPNEEEGKRIKSRKNRVYQHSKISPNGEYIAYTSNYSGKHCIWISNLKTGKTKRIARLEHRLKQIVDYSYPIIAWHPTSEILTYIAEEKGKLVMTLYNLKTRKKKRRILSYFDKILDFAYSNNGLNMVFSAVLKGQTDLFIYNLSANTSKQITNDAADEMTPRFVDNSKKVIFASNRIGDTLRIDKSINPKTMRTYDLFIYDAKNDSKVLKRLTNTPYYNETSPEEIGQNKYSYLSDKNGIINRIVSKYDSTISYVDTTIHYRYYSKNNAMSNYDRNINYYSINNGENAISQIFLKNKRHRFVNGSYGDSVPNKPENTVSRIERNKEFAIKDSLIELKRQQEIAKMKLRDSLAKNKLIPHPDSVALDINYYVFENEKEHPYHIVYKTDSVDIKAEENAKKWPERRVYFTSFYPDVTVTQIDFAFLNDMYQAYSFGAYYFNPGLNLFTKIGISDLFEDYKLTGGFRISGNFDSFEYLFSLEDLKYRLDKQYIYHRLSMQNYLANNQVQKIITNEFKVKVSYPFNQVHSIRATSTLRSDRYISLTRGITSLLEDDTYRFLGGVKLEYIFDNTIERGLNLYNGIRSKVFAEYFKNLEKGGTNTYIFGADFRIYQPIHRNIIFAGRVAGSASYGSGKLIYYLGGVDNWINFSQEVPTFDQTVNVDQTENYIFQAVATNMRGFVQNARNGNKFVLTNAEIRFPIIRYFVNRPMQSEFLNNFQIVGFADAGTAWSGVSPWDKSDAYNTEIVGGKGNPVKIIIDKRRSPIVVGYGFGLRSKILGYFMRFDWAWGIDNNVILPQVFYFSLSLDF